MTAKNYQEHGYVQQASNKFIIYLHQKFGADKHLNTPIFHTRNVIISNLSECCSNNLNVKNALMFMELNLN